MSADIDNVLIVGNPEEFHVGAHLFKAAKNIGLKTGIIDVSGAFSGSRLIQSVLWKFCGHRPQNLSSFGMDVVAQCKQGGYSTILTTGIAPLDQKNLGRLKKQGVRTLNYLTDDPWNRAHYAPWFLNAIGCYDSVFTTRRSNISDLKKAGCRNIQYCPFGYDNEAHSFPPGNTSDLNGPDIMFVGGADSDRMEMLEPLVVNNFHLALYGGYWDVTQKFAKYSCGNADLSTLARRGQEAKITLCLVRRANRDGHVMRTFEAAVSGACMLVEDTLEHREIFGINGDCVVYFGNRTQMIHRAQWLIDHPEERSRLRNAVYYRIAKSSGNDYSDRLLSILKIAKETVFHG